jgi:chromosomal replication initiation ATPase DnaA
MPIIVRYKNYKEYPSGETFGSINEIISKIKNNVLTGLNIPDMYRQVSFDNFDKTGNITEFNKVKEVVDLEFDSISCLLWSKNLYGVGKTHLLYAMVKEYLLSNKRIIIKQLNSNLVSVLYNGVKIGIFNEYDLLNKIRDTFKPNNEISEGDVFKELGKYQVLCIDDLLKYQPSNLDFYQRVMFQIVNERYNNNQSLIITTNKNLVELGEYLGMATSDRLCAMTKNYQLQLKGNSHRVK